MAYLAMTLLLLTQPAGEGQPTEPITAPVTVQVTAPVTVQVRLLEPSGAVVAAGGALVEIERMRQPRPGDEGGAELVQAWRAVAAADGSARFEGVPPLGTAESDEVVARWHGHAVRRALEPPDDGRTEPLVMIVREVSHDLSALRMGVRLTLAPRDSGLQIEHFFEIDNPTHAVIDTDHGAGLVLPLAAPAPFAEPVESFLPPRPESREMLTQHSPEGGRLLVENGRLVFRGGVSPDGVMVRVVYMLPYDGNTDHTYGLRMPVPAIAVSMVVRNPEKVLLQTSFRAPSRAMVRAFMGGEERTAVLLDAPGAGEVVLFDVNGTPDRHAFYRPLTAGLGGLVVIALMVLYLAGRRPAKGASGR